MSVIIILLIVSIVVAGAFLLAFIWSVRTGQLEDDYGASYRALWDDQPQNNINPSDKTV